LGPFFYTNMIHKHYKNIEDCPIWNLQKVNETGDLRYLVKGFDDIDDIKEEELDLQLLANSYSSMMEEVSNTFGLSEEYIDKARVEKELLILSYKILLGEKHLKAIRDHKIRTIEESKAIGSTNDTPFDEQIVVLESFFKIPVDVKKTSSSKYYTYLKVLKKDAERIRAENKRQN
jgi:hypothetical protein